MKVKLYSVVGIAFITLLLISSHSTDKSAASRLSSGAFVPAAGGSWYFAVSGDSRDCGDLIMPKIAQALRDNHKQAPTKFYWHLGDFRRMFTIDCDIAVNQLPGFKCEDRTKETQAKELKTYSLTAYQAAAWDDFIKHQLAPFKTAHVPVYLGIGNHELYWEGRTKDQARADFRLKFKEWLTQKPLRQQRAADLKQGISSSAGATYYHFVLQGVDFIYLDNAQNDAFDPQQVAWLGAVLAADATDNAIKTIIVGMHEALPYSTARIHAMDATCEGVCMGLKVYDMLYAAQSPLPAGAVAKHVYVFASHSHYFHEKIYDTAEHEGHVLPGWIIGTAGAEQYQETIRYGYLQVEVKSDGTIAVAFRQVDRDSPPAATGPNADRLAKFCFEQNKVKPTDTHKSCPPCAGH